MVNTKETFETCTCYLCSKICLTDSVFCDLCDTWLHRKCLKMTKKQYDSLGKSPLPYFCPKCISISLPFSNLTNYQFDCNVTLSNKHLNIKPCLKCGKHVHKGNSSYCISGKHFSHINCHQSSTTINNNANESVWCCTNCLKLPFTNLSNEEMLPEVLTRSKNAKHSFKINLNRKLTLFNKELPMLTIPDPNNDEDDDSPINFRYYSVKDTHEQFGKLDHGKTFSVFHTNIRSYGKNFSELCAVLTSFRFDFDVIGLTETWDSVENPITPEEMNQYHPIERANGNTQNAGAALYIKKNRNYIRRLDIEGKNNLSKTESLFVEIECENQNILLGVIYRHPNNRPHDFIDSMKDLLSTLSKERKRIVLMGDYNINLLNSSVHKESERFLDVMLDNNLIPYITQPTRFDKNLNGSLIDNIFFSELSTECVSGNIMNHFSDHLPNFLIIPLEKNRINYKLRKQRRDYQNFDITEFRNDFKAVNFPRKVGSLKNPNDMYNLFHEGLTVLLDLHCSMKKMSKSELKKSQKPWVNDAILSKIRDKNILYTEFLQTSDTRKLEQSRVLRNEVNHSIRKNKVAYQKSRLYSLKNNAKKLWKEMNSIIGKKTDSNISSIMYHKNKKITDTKEIANYFNSHYSKVADNLLKSIRDGEDPLKNLAPQAKSFFFTPTTSYEVLNIINSLDHKKAIDIYNFPISIIKQVSDLVSPLLSHIINSSVSNGIFPDKLKLAKVVPLYKSGSKTEFANYRPISILPVFDKVFEKIVHKRIMEYLVEFKILNENQFGFQKKRSTSHGVLSLANTISSGLKRKNFCCTLFLDLAKAFDTVDHSILLGKLGKLGFRGPIYDWFKSYLSNRYQSVNVNNHFSNPVLMKYGVPQGSVLGPLLFLIFINDIATASKKFSYTLFADDTCITAEHKSIQELELLVNTELIKIEQWLVNNRLSLNIGKSCFLLFSGEKQIERFEVNLAGKAITRRKSTKYLGIIIDDKLLWKDQIENVLRKIRQGSGIMKKLSYIIPFSVNCSLYHSFIQSHIQYGILSWGSPQTKGLSKISNVTNKIINKMNRYKPNNINDFKPLNVNNIYKLESCKLIYQLIKNEIPAPLKCLFNFNTNVHNHRTRQASNNGLTTIHLDQATLPIMHFGPLSWNSLCLQYQNANSINFFASSLKRKLLESN